MTPLDKQQRFYKELKSLLLKYGAEIILERETPLGGYYDVQKIIVDFNWDEQICQEHGSGTIPSLDLGSYEGGK